MNKLSLIVLLSIICNYVSGQDISASIKKVVYKDQTYFQITYTLKYGRLDSIFTRINENYTVAGNVGHTVQSFREFDAYKHIDEYTFNYVALKAGKITIDTIQAFYKGERIYPEMPALVLDVAENEVKLSDKKNNYRSNKAINKLDIVDCLGKNFYSKEVQKVCSKLSKPEPLNNLPDYEFQVYYLKDGIKFWMNADSSIKGIILFNGNQYSYSGNLPYGIQLKMNYSELTDKIGAGQVREIKGNLIVDKIIRCSWLLDSNIYISSDLSIETGTLDNLKTATIDELTIYKKK